MGVVEVDDVKKCTSVSFELMLEEGGTVTMRVAGTATLSRPMALAIREFR